MREFIRQDQDVEMNAADTLVRIGRRAAPALIASLKDGNSDVSGQAAEALVKIGQPGAPALIEALKDSNSGGRGRAAEALGAIGDSTAVPALIAALDDSDSEVRQKAAEALGMIGDDSAVPALIAALKDGYSYVHRAEYSQDLTVALSRMTDINWRLRKNGLLALLCTLGNFGILVLSLSLRTTLNEKILTTKIVFLIPALAALLSVGLYETFRREGDALFEEISDELEWDIRSRRISAKMPQEKPELAVRTVLRKFARASDLPLIPGRFGPAIYAGLNLLLGILQVYLLFSL